MSLLGMLKPKLEDIIRLDSLGSHLAHRLGAFRFSILNFFSDLVI